MYDMIWRCSLVRYDLAVLSGLDLYDINLWATHTIVLSIRGVTIPIYLVSIATDSIKPCVVLFKTVTIPTSDPKSEFLCQLSVICAEPTDSPEPPRTPGISPMPSSPRITCTVIVWVLSLSTWSRSSIHNGQSDLVVACQLKSSRAFNSNVTLTQTSLWLPPPWTTWNAGENATSPRDISKTQIGAKTDPLERDTILQTQTIPLFYSLLISISNICSGGVPINKETT